MWEDCPVVLKDGGGRLHFKTETFPGQYFEAIMRLDFTFRPISPLFRERDESLVYPDEEKEILNLTKHHSAFSKLWVLMFYW